MKEEILIPLGTFILGLFINHIWEKFKKRISLVKYTVWHLFLGGSADDPRFGSLKLLYNDRPVRNLYMSRVLLSNESNRDLSNVELNVVSDRDSAILVSHGRNMSSLNDLSFTDKYTKVLSELKPENMEYIFGRRDYKLPVLNRGDKVEISLLLTNFKSMQPNITVSCDYPGVKMKYARVFPELFGEPQIHSALLGTLIALLLCVLIIFLIHSKTIAVLLAAFICLFASLLGVLARKICKLIIKILE